MAIILLCGTASASEPAKKLAAAKLAAAPPLTNGSQEDYDDVSFLATRPLTPAESRIVEKKGAAIANSPSSIAPLSSAKRPRS